MLKDRRSMKATRPFVDRRDAGRQLARRLLPYRHLTPVVLGLPRGGIVVAYEVAEELGAPLDVCVVCEIGAPAQPELGIGAVGEDGVLFVDREAVARAGVSEDELTALVEQQRAEVTEHVGRFRRGAPPIPVRDKVVLLVDDGITSGGTARAAMEVLASRGAARIVLAVPVGSTETLDALASAADELVCLRPEKDFTSVGESYEDFSATTDHDVVDLHDRARARPPDTEEPRRRSSASSRAPEVHNVRVPGGESLLEGKLVVPLSARGLVVFAHGSGSGRHSPRNRYLARELEGAGFATLLFDLLGPEEAMIGALAPRRFDIELLASRLAAAVDWAREQPSTRRLPIGLFGSGTGAAAALVAAAERPQLVCAIVSRAGRLDLVDAWLPRVTTPTLLVVGAADPQALATNRSASERLAGERQLEIVPNARRLFEEPGALDHVARAATAWFARHVEPYEERVTG